MSFQKVIQNLKNVKKCPLLNLNSALNPNPKIPEAIISAITTTAAATSTLFSNLTPSLVHLILSDPHVHTPGCLDFLTFLHKNQSLLSFKLDFDAHLTLICRLVEARDFSDAENLLTFLTNDESFRYPFATLASFMENHCIESMIISKVFNLLLKVYSDEQKFEEVVETFHYMRKNEIEINERTCTIHLSTLMRSDQLNFGLEFFYLMLKSGIEISVFSLTVVVDGLCKNGEIRRARELVEEMVGRGLKPNIVTCNTLVDACAKRWNFGELDLILELMNRERVEYSAETYKFLIDGFATSGKIGVAEEMLTEMNEKGFSVHSHLYTVIINGYCRSSNMEKACLLFSKMIERGVYPDGDACGTLVSSLCKIGKGPGEESVDVLQKKVIQMEESLFDMLIRWCCNEAMISEAVRLLSLMDKTRYVVHVSTYHMMASELCKLDRVEEAKCVLNMVVKKGMIPLVDTIECNRHKMAVSVEEDMDVSPITTMYPDLIDSNCESGSTEETQVPIDGMQCEELILSA